MDVELSEVRDFLARHAPFDVLPEEVLDGIPRQCTLRYARRGTVVLEVGQQGKGLYVVRSGAVDVVDESGTLIERVDTGSAFGMSSLLERRPTRFRCVATEDSLLVVLPTQLFESLAREHTAFVTFYTATHRDRLTKAIANLQRATSGTTVLGTVVGELVAREPVTTEAGASVADAAAAMSRAGVSSLLVVDGAGLCGIVTDRDLRNRVLAVGLDPGRPVREVMTAPALTVRSDAMAFEALLEMVSRGIHHLPVVGGHGELIGMITTTDLVRLGNSDPVVLAADIGRQRTLAGVVELAGRIPPALAELVDRDVSAADIGRVMTALGDAVRRRVVALVEEEIGPPPTAYSWVVLGSAAREEEALAADQDHALVLEQEGHDEWFERLAVRVTDTLEMCGWPRCPGDMMATNSRWRRTVDQWRRTFARVGARAGRRGDTGRGDLLRHAPLGRGRAADRGGAPVRDGVRVAAPARPPDRGGVADAPTAGLLPRPRAGEGRCPPRDPRPQARHRRSRPARPGARTSRRVERPGNPRAARGRRHCRRPRHRDGR